MQWPSYKVTGCLSPMHEVVATRAYFLWEDAGKPENTAHANWFSVLHQMTQEVSYRLWDTWGRPKGLDGGIWGCAERQLQTARLADMVWQCLGCPPHCRDHAWEIAARTVEGW